MTLRRASGNIVYTEVLPEPDVRATLARERLPGQDVIIYASDLDFSSTGGEADGRAMAIHARAAKCTADPICDQTPTEPYVTLSSEGVYNLRLWLQNEAGNTNLSEASCEVTISAYSGTNIWTGEGLTDSWHEAANWNAGVPVAGQDVLIDSDGARLTNATAALGSFTLAAGNTLTVEGWQSALTATEMTIGGKITNPDQEEPPEQISDPAELVPSHRILLIGTNITVTATGHLDVDRRGWHGRVDNIPYRLAGFGAGGRRCGGGYGGRGYTHGQYIGGGIRYGSFREPDDLGSGGGGNRGTGGPGSNDANHPAAGGGAIRVIANDMLTVEGEISARGENRVYSHGGAGSGGSIWLSAGTIAGAGEVIADGGVNDGGGGGRIAFQCETLTFDGVLRARGPSGAYNGTFNFMDHYGPDDDLVIRHDIALPPYTNYQFRSLTVTDGATLHIQSDFDPEIVSRVFVAENVTIDEGATITADGDGYLYGGPGQGVGNSGGSHGGRAVQHSSGLAPAPYGSVREPDQLGSGGSPVTYTLTSKDSNYGGGAVLITAGGVVTIDGVISADGRRSGSDGGTGTGSGGSVWITAPAIEGDGIVRANAGPVHSDIRGSGGGGRIAFTTPTNNFTGIIQAMGRQGHTANNRAGHGTFNFMDHYGPDDDLVIRGDIALSPSNNWRFGSLTVSDDATLDIQSTTGIVSRVYVQGDIFVSTNGVISADGFGYQAGDGPGSAPSGGNGGSYGGWGAGETGGGPYGEAHAPIRLGSDGAGWGDGGSRESYGGGAALLFAGGTVTVNGLISADGWQGGGSGGSIMIATAQLGGIGELRAQGGALNGGGGGRIAVWLWPRYMPWSFIQGMADGYYPGGVDLFDPAESWPDLTFSVAGGDGGGEGTLFFGGFRSGTMLMLR